MINQLALLIVNETNLCWVDHCQSSKDLPFLGLQGHQSWNLGCLTSDTCKVHTCWNSLYHCFKMHLERNNRPVFEECLFKTGLHKTEAQMIQHNSVVYKTASTICLKLRCNTSQCGLAKGDDTTSIPHAKESSTWSTWKKMMPFMYSTHFLASRNSSTEDARYALYGATPRNASLCT